MCVWKLLPDLPKAANFQFTAFSYLFIKNINEKIKNATKGINIIRKMNLSLPRSSILRINKSFIMPHLAYGDVIFDQPNNSSLSDKIESVQSDAALAITSVIRGTSKG